MRERVTTLYRWVLGWIGLWPLVKMVDLEISEAELSSDLHYGRDGR